LPKLIFRGSYIRFVDLRYDEKSKTPYLKLNFTASFSEPVREAMEWGEPPAGYGACDLDGEFSATHFILTPNGRELKQAEIQMSAKSIGDFQLYRVKGEDGDSTHYELRFQVVTPDVDAAAKLQGYIAIIGKGEAQLRVNYEAQSELEMEAEAVEEPDRLISKEQAADTGVIDDVSERPSRRRKPELVT
jgi:hypothetical protein